MRFKRQSQILLVLISVVLTIGLVISPSKTRNQVWFPIEPALAAEALPDPLLIPMALFQAPQNSIFGVEMVKINNFRGLDEIIAADAAWVRRNALLWSDVESNEGTYNWSNVSSLDDELKSASERGLEVILVVRRTPIWAQMDIDNNPRTPHFCGPIRPEKIQSFANFMYEAVKRYSKPPYNVKYFEVWNEPDAERGLSILNPDPPYGCWGDKNDPYYGGEYYADVLTYVYPSMKAANPGIQVAIGGLLLACKQGVSNVSCDHSEKYFEGILRRHGANDGGNFFDLVNYHAYDYYFNKLGKYGNGGWGSNLVEGSAFLKKLPFIEGTLENFGFGNKEIILTETALLCGITGFEPMCQTADYENTKAYYAAQSFAQSIDKGFQTNIWYSATATWRGSALLSSNLDPLPAYYAYDFVEDELSTARYKRDLWEYQNIKGYEYDRSKKVIWMMWSTLTDSNGYIIPVSITLPNEPSRVYTVSGSELNNFSGTSLLVTSSPLYVEWDK